MISRRIVLSLLAAFGAIGLVMTSAVGRSDELVKEISSNGDTGAVFYADNYAACHGPNLKGVNDWRRRDDDGRLKPPPHDASGQTCRHADNQLFTYTKHGGAGAMAKSGLHEFNSGMPAFEDVLADQEFRDVQEEMSRQNLG